MSAGRNKNLEFLVTIKLLLLPYDFRKYGFQLFSFHLRQKKPKTTHQAKKPHKNPSCFLLLSHLSHRVPKAVFAVAMLLKPGFLGKTRRAEAWFLQILLLYANVQTVAALAHAFVCTSCSAGFACAKWLALTLLRPGNCSACSIAFLLAIQYNTFLISISTFYLFRNLHKKFNIFYTFFFSGQFLQKTENILNSYDYGLKIVFQTYYKPEIQFNETIV